MQETAKRFRYLFYASVGMIAAGSLVLGLVPLTTHGLVNEKVQLLIGACFWLLHIAGYILLIFANRDRRALRAAERKRKNLHLRAGWCSFGRTLVGIIFDIATLLIVALLVLFALLNKDIYWWYYLLIAAGLAAIQLRCFFNGKNYVYLLITIHKERKK